MQSMTINNRKNQDEENECNFDILSDATASKPVIPIKREIDNSVAGSNNPLDSEMKAYLD